MIVRVHLPAALPRVTWEHVQNAALATMSIGGVLVALALGLAGF